MPRLLYFWLPYCISVSTTNAHPPPDDINHAPPSAIAPLAASIKMIREGVTIMVHDFINAPNEGPRTIIVAPSEVYHLQQFHVVVGGGGG